MYNYTDPIVAQLMTEMGRRGEEYRELMYERNALKDKLRITTIENLRLRADLLEAGLDV